MLQRSEEPLSRAMLAPKASLEIGATDEGWIVRSTPVMLETLHAGTDCHCYPTFRGLLVRHLANVDP